MALSNESTFGRCGMLVAKFAHSPEVWNSTDFNKRCESTEGEAEDSNPLQVNMGTFAPVVEYKTHDPPKLPGPVYKIDPISGVALILVVIPCMSQGYDNKAGFRQCERGVAVAGQRSSSSVRDEDHRMFSSVDCPVQGYVLMKGAK